MKIIIYQQYYNTKERFRESELIACAYRQYEEVLKTIGAKMILLSEGDQSHPLASIENENLLFTRETRMSYKLWLELTSKEFKKAGQNFISVLINSDCFLRREDIYRIRDFYKSTKEANQRYFLAVSRHDYYTGKLHSMPSVSQDMWAIEGKECESVLRRTNNTGNSTNFYLGKPGCDNRIAYIMHKENFKVENKCKEIKVMHIHKDRERPYTEADRINGKYLFVNPR